MSVRGHEFVPARVRRHEGCSFYSFDNSARTFARRFNLLDGILRHISDAEESE
jgi:hypothetical protein